MTTTPNGTDRAILASATAMIRAGRTMLTAAVVLALTAAFARPVAAQEDGPGHTDGPGTAHFDSLGTVHFPTSAPDDAERPFLRGVALLHSFEYDAAARAFRRAQERAPDFAMAYWGEAMTYNHPLWRQQDREAALAALRRLAPTPEARRAKAATPREKAWLGTVEVLYGDGPKERRDTLYSRAMERLTERFPDDDEAEAFYALSLLGLEQGERHVPTFMRAGAIALDLFGRHPRHPGAVHYAIHSFDDPAHAPLGLDAARAYADIAPAAAHAQHMTSHIFVALGMWKEAVAANETAARTTARDRWGSAGGNGAGGAAARGAAGEGAAGEHPELYPCGHYAEWLSYAYLQQGRPTPARRLIEQCATLPDGDPGSVARMRAHYLVDTGAWAGPIARMTPDTARMPDRWLLARDFGDGLAAARRGELDAARSEIASLEARRSDLRSGLAADAGVLALILEAVVRFEAGETDAALATARRAVEAEAAQPVPYGPPSTYLPPDELLGRMLLSLDRPEEARGAFRRALERTPRRPASLLGLARATSEVGARDVAAESYAELRRIWTDAEEGWPGLAETRSALDKYGDTPLARPD